MKKLMTLLASAMIMFIFSSCCNNTPSGVADSYHSALKSGNFEKAMSFTTMKDNAEDVSAYVLKLEGMEYELVSYEIISEEIAEDGKTAKVKVKTSANSTMGKDEDKESTVNLELIDDKWLIKVM